MDSFFDEIRPSIQLYCDLSVEAKATNFTDPEVDDWFLRPHPELEQCRIRGLKAKRIGTSASNQPVTRPVLRKKISTVDNQEIMSNNPTKRRSSTGLMVKEASEVTPGSVSTSSLIRKSSLGPARRVSLSKNSKQVNEIDLEKNVTASIDAHVLENGTEDGNQVEEDVQDIKSTQKGAQKRKKERDMMAELAIYQKKKEMLQTQNKKGNNASKVVTKQSCKHNGQRTSSMPTNPVKSARRSLTSFPKKVDTTKTVVTKKQAIEKKEGPILSDIERRVQEHNAKFN